MRFELKTSTQPQLPANSAAVVFGVHLSCQTAYPLDRKSPAVRLCM